MSLQRAVVSLSPDHVSARNPSGPQALGRAGVRELVSKEVASALYEPWQVGAYFGRKNQSLITGWYDLKSSTLTALVMGCWRLWGSSCVHFRVAFSVVLPHRVESTPRRKQRFDRRAFKCLSIFLCLCFAFHSSIYFPNYLQVTGRGF